MSNERRTNYFFPSVVQNTTIENAENLNAGIMTELNKIREEIPNSLPEGWSCNLYTTISSGINILQRPALKELGQHIVDEAAAFAQTLALDVRNHPLNLNECWVNVYGDGDSQEAHTHPNSVLSGIYYVAAPPGCGELLFHSPFSDMMLDPPRTQTNDINTPLVGLKPKPGDMVLFRSWLRHSVKPTEGKEERISIAFNLTM